MPVHLKTFNCIDFPYHKNLHYQSAATPPLSYTSNPNEITIDSEPLLTTLQKQVRSASLFIRIPC